MSGLKQKTISGVKWSAFSQFSTQGISFVIGMILARLLSPEDYGVTGMIVIFFAISSTFISSGFGTALIRKQDRTDVDFSTVFYFNVVVAISFYVLLFVSAPAIARFYEMPILIPVTRVSALNLVIGALGGIQQAQFTIRLDFKTPTKIAVITTVLSGIVGITLAYLEYGVWALVLQGTLASILSTLLFWYWGKWRPLRVFSIASFRELFAFGSKLLASGLLDTIYNNIYPLIIGKFFSAAQLGFFNRAKGLSDLPSSNVTNIIQRVTFPVLSELQQDDERLTINYRRILKMSAFIIFPLMGILMVVAKPLIAFLLTDKWLPAAPYLQLLCLSGMLYPIHAINLNLLQVKGRSDLFLRLEIIKKILGVTILGCAIPFGVSGMCLGTVITSYLCLVINTYYTGKLINLGFFKQAVDLLPTLILTAISVLGGYAGMIQLNHSLAQIICGGSVTALLYLSGSFLLCRTETDEMKQILLKR